jgi:hypothetical protein
MIQRSAIRLLALLCLVAFVVGMPTSASMCVGELVAAALHGHDHTSPGPCESKDCPGEAPDHFHPSMATPAVPMVAGTPGGEAELESAGTLDRLMRTVMPIFIPPKVRGFARA